MKKRYRWLLALFVLAVLAVCLFEFLPDRKEGAWPVVRFLGAARRVGGSCLLVEVGPTRFIVDCGALGERGAGALPPLPDSLAFVILTHAHIDHCGLVPELFKAGFRGPVYCTRGTAELVPIMLEMMRGISRDEAGKEAYDRAVASLSAVPFGETVTVGPVAFTLRRAEHLLGACFVEMALAAGADTVRLVVSGDIGAGNSLLLRPLETPGRADYVVMESTYGGTVREQSEEGPLGGYAEFGRAVGEAIARGGDVLIPAFTLGRTQEVMAVLDRLIRMGVLPRETEVYVDSPTARKITAVYRKVKGDLSSWAGEYYPGEPLRYPTLREVRSGTSLKVHARRHRPAVFVSSSGDLQFATSPRHLMRMFADSTSLVCIIGWQSPGSLGARLLAGETPVLVRHQEGKTVQQDWISPAVAVKGVHCFSGHADAGGLLAWLRTIRGVRHVFLVHGEERQARPLAESIREKLGIPVDIPERGTAYVLSPKRLRVAGVAVEAASTDADRQTPQTTPAMDTTYWGEE
jgi:metallo-beta-lactamase family protein